MRDKFGRFIKGNKPPKTSFKKGFIPWNKGKIGIQKAWNKGKKLSKEHRKKLSLAHIGKPAWNKGIKGLPSPFKGKHHSEKSKLKNKLAHLNKKHSENTKQKMSFSHKGSKNYNWVGGRVKHTGGYIESYNPNHPYVNKRIYILEHRLAMEKHIGRYLTSNEIVHHVNGNKSDNKIDNLRIMSRSEHCKFHNPRLGTGTKKLSKISNHQNS